MMVMMMVMVSIPWHHDHARPIPVIVIAAAIVAVVMVMRVVVMMIVLRLLEELQQQAANLRRLLLLHPVACAIDQMTADHLRACTRLHGLVNAGTLVSAPVLFPGNEARGHVDAAAGIGLELGTECAGGAATVPLQAALEAGAPIFGAVESELVVGQPCVGRNSLLRGHFLGHRLSHVAGEIHDVISR